MHPRYLLPIGLLMLAWAADAGAVKITDHTLTRPEGARHYLAAEPDPPASVKRPVLILLHGHGANGAMMLGQAAFGGFRTQQWADLAAREHVLILAPDGVTASDGKTAWNDCRSDAATNTTTDDVGLIAALIDVAIARFDADPARVYVFGVSNGGVMAYRAGIELAPRLAAIGVQSGAMAARSACPAPTHPLSVFIEHGTDDPIIPYAGGEVGTWFLRHRGTSIGTEQAAALWRKLDRLPDAATTVHFPHLHADDPTSATRSVWGADPAGLQVELLRIDGGGHVEASKSGRLSWVARKLVGDMNHDLDTAQEAWTFFKDKRVSATP